MDIFLYVMCVIVGLCVVTMLGCLYLLWHNNRVFDARMKMLRKTSDAAQADINRGDYDGWAWRYDALNSVSYTDMMHKFWKRPDSLYDNLDFIDPDKRKST